MRYASIVVQRRLFPCFVCLIVACIALAAGAQTVERRGNTFIIEGTLEAAAGMPQVHVQLSRNGRVLEGKSMLAELDLGLGLEDILGEQGMESSFAAFLDTGASAYVISPITAERFGIRRDDGAVYHEVGVHGETPMDVSMPYALAVAGTTGMLTDRPGNRFQSVARRAVMQMSRPPEQGAGDELTTAMLMGEINVVGMPAIQQFVVDIDPSPMGAGLGNLQLDENALADPLALLDNMDDLGVGPAVRLLPMNTPPNAADVTVPLNLVNFNRMNNPKDRGSKPDLAPNPVIENIVTQQRGRNFKGDWLLDTGAMVSIISTKQAILLGLIDVDGEPMERVTFQIPLGGISGRATVADGFVIEHMTVPAAGGKQITYRNVHAVVHDVGIQLDSGDYLILDGVFGLNLMMPTMGGLATGLPTGVAGGPFSRIVIDASRGELRLTVAQP